VFRASSPVDAVGGSAPVAVEMLLMMLPEADATFAAPRRISGVPWTVTEVFGDVWPNEDPATLVIDDEMNFAIFSGCNRFAGQIAPSSSSLSFLENIAGTMMACPDEMEALERRFLAAIMQVSDFVRYGAGLVMMDTDGRAGSPPPAIVTAKLIANVAMRLQALCVLGRPPLGRGDLHPRRDLVLRVVGMPVAGRRAEGHR